MLMWGLKGLVKIDPIHKLSNLWMLVTNLTIMRTVVRLRRTLGSRIMKILWEDSVAKRQLYSPYCNCERGEWHCDFGWKQLCRHQYFMGLLLTWLYAVDSQAKKQPRMRQCNGVDKWKIEYHPNGWMIFSFEMEEDRELIRRMGTQYVYGIPLVLCSMPTNLRFHFRIWITYLISLLAFVVMLLLVTLCHQLVSLLRLVKEL